MKKTLLTLALTVAATAPALAQVGDVAKPAAPLSASSPPGTAVTKSAPVKHAHGKHRAHKKGAHKGHAKADASNGATATPAVPASGKK